jgi:hypothetical protein
MDTGEALRWMTGGVFVAVAWAMIPRMRRPPGVDPTTPWGPRQVWGPLPAEPDDRARPDTIARPCPQGSRP